MKKRSAGIIVYRNKGKAIEILLVHLGGPFWKNKKNSWDLPKGEVKEGEDFLMAAVREFKEETGLKLEDEDIKKISFFKDLDRGDKIIKFFILEKDFGDNLKPQSNEVLIEFPPKSGKKMVIPEVDQMKYFSLDEAENYVLSYLKEFIKEIKKFIKNSTSN